jgi:hypothetical protein
MISSRAVMITKPNLVGSIVTTILVGISALAAPALTEAAGAELAQVTSDQQLRTMRLRIHVDGKVFNATLADNETARDFVSLLPLTLAMSDLFKREKFAKLPRPISTAGPRSRTYEVGDIILWSPGPDVAIFYRHDGQTIPSPGSILIAKADADVRALNVPGSVRATIERLEEQHARASTMTWSEAELRKIVAADDLHISPFREDGVTYGTPTYIWSVAVDGSLYVRAYNGQNSRWYKAAMREKTGRIIAAGMTREVSFEPVDGPLNDRIDDAYRAKYRGNEYLNPMISARARSATVRIIPGDSGS